MEEQVKILEEKLRIATEALGDIAAWNDELEDDWDDTGNRASSALQTIQMLGAF